MFNLEEFEQDQVIYPLVEKLDKLLDKNKTEKAEKVIIQLEELLDKKKHAIPVSYILSILAENDFSLITESVLSKLESFLTTDEPKLKLNILIIIGFAMISKQNYLEKYLADVVSHLKDSSKDVRDNLFYFLQEIGKKNANMLCTYKKEFINALINEPIEENQISLLSFLEKCDAFDFENLFNLREVFKTLINQYFTSDSSKIYSKILTLIKKVFPSFQNSGIENYRKTELLEALQNLFLMKKYNFSEVSKETGVELKDFMKTMSKRSKNENRLYFYINQKEQKTVYFYELEKEKLTSVFSKEEKLHKKRACLYYSRS